MFMFMKRAAFQSRSEFFSVIKEFKSYLDTFGLPETKGRVLPERGQIGLWRSARPPDPPQGRLLQRAGPEGFLYDRLPALSTTRPLVQYVSTNQ